MPIQYRIRQIYGKDTIYIVDEKIAEAVTTMTGQKTLTPQAKRGLELLGYKLQQVL